MVFSFNDLQVARMTLQRTLLEGVKYFSALPGEASDTGGRSQTDSC